MNTQAHFDNSLAELEAENEDLKRQLQNLQCECRDFEKALGDIRALALSIIRAVDMVRG
jgi:hypothetical protein